jgi:hypothetical protein
LAWQWSEQHLRTSQTDDTDVLAMARALDRAIKAAPPNNLDAEEIKAVLMTGISDAARRGVRDEDILTDAALAALALYDDSDMQDVMRNAPL